MPPARKCLTGPATAPFFRFEEFHERLPSTAVRTWLKGFRPLTLNARPRDCLRAGLGACIGALAAVFACQALFGSELALRLAAPLGASAVLLFALASSPLAQPWSMLGGNLVAALAGGLSAYWFDTIWPRPWSAWPSACC